jgi:hypothetical protein
MNRRKALQVLTVLPVVGAIGYMDKAVGQEKTEPILVTSIEHRNIRYAFEQVGICTGKSKPHSVRRIHTKDNWILAVEVVEIGTGQNIHYHWQAKLGHPSEEARQLQDWLHQNKK